MEDGSNPSMNRNIFEFLCDEAQLPNTQAATGTLKGRYTGEGQINYPHTRIFTEISIGFQCDANMTPLKFLYDWYGQYLMNMMMQMVLPRHNEMVNRK